MGWGGGGVEVLPGWIPDNTGIQWEMSNFGGGDKPPLLFSIYIVAKVNRTSRSSCGYQTLMLTFTISWRTA